MTDGQLALLVSAVSAAVAGISFAWTIGWSIWQHRQLHQPRLTVIATNSLPVGPGGAGEWCVGVNIVNDGGVAVTITTIKLVVRNDAERRGIFPNWVHAEPRQLPLKLTPGDQWKGLIERQPLSTALHQHFGKRSKFALWVVAIDAADREFRTKFSLSW